MVKWDLDLNLIERGSGKWASAHAPTFADPFLHIWESLSLCPRCCPKPCMVLNISQSWIYNETAHATGSISLIIKISKILCYPPFQTRYWSSLSLMRRFLRHWLVLSFHYSHEGVIRVHCLILWHSYNRSHSGNLIVREWSSTIDHINIPGIFSFKFPFTACMVWTECNFFLI